MLNDLDALTNLCASYDLHSFVDCMSSVGTTQLDLSKISMATASSGKALAAFSGLALVFSNFKPTELRSGPLYFDLGYYLRKGYIPFTISSNFINALSYSISQKATGDQYLLIDKYGLRFFDIFRSYHLVPYSSRCSKVFTIVLPDGIFGLFVKEMEEKNISLSYKSDYLKSRSWIQLALFGYYQEKELNYAYSTIEKSLRELIVCRTI
jgi:aspartate aminotransferase-like enzyme